MRKRLDIWLQEFPAVYLYEGNSTSEKNSNDMDLNKDGTISIDEIMKYMELQEQENLTTGETQGEHNNNNSNQCFKPSMSQVINAYSAFL